MEVKANNPILYKGTGTPYLAIFDNQGIPVMNPLTGIPLGAYISSWSYVYDEENEYYVCEVDLDEDDMVRFLKGDVRACPYYQSDDEYKIVRKQI